MSAQAPNTRLKPSDIKLGEVLPLPGAFNNLEKETAAAWIVKFCQERNGDTWAPFSLADLQNLARSQHFAFHGLDQEGYVAVQGGVVTVTERFVARCYSASVG